MSIVFSSMDGSNALKSYGKGACENWSAEGENIPDGLVAGASGDAAMLTIRGELIVKAVALSEFSINFLRDVFMIRGVWLI
jgi:hypothetical protein